MGGESQKRGREGRRGERKVIDEWKVGGFREGRRTEEGKETERGKGEPHHAVWGRMKHVFLSPATHCKWMALQSCHQRLILAAWKWKKGQAKGREEGKKMAEKSFSCWKLTVNSYIFWRQIWQDGITLPLRRQSFANAIKCRYKFPTQIHLIWDFWAFQQQSSSEACVYSKRPLQFSVKKRIVQ